MRTEEEIRKRLTEVTETYEKINTYDEETASLETERNTLEWVLGEI